MLGRSLEAPSAGEPEYSRGQCPARQQAPGGCQVFRLTSLDHIVLRVAVVERSMAFYTSVLGCTVEHMNDEIGLYQLRAGDSIIDLVDVAGVLGREGGPPPGPTAHNVDHFCVRIEPFDEDDLRRHLTDHGVEPGRVYNNWGADGRGPSMYVDDPDGNTVELKGPPTHPYDPAVGYIAAP